MAEHTDLRWPGSDTQVVPGGFLGVDVFLVISGFLITSLLVEERRRSGRIDLRAFWVRRARRLLPAVFVVVAATAVLVPAAGLPVDAATTRGDALAALGYVANWQFVFTEQSYFAAFGMPSPYRHLWSLAVEEQWYLVFPPLFAVACALVRRSTGVLVALLVAGALASAAWMAALHVPLEDPSRAYYGTDTRAQALLVGAALAVVASGYPRAVRRFAGITPALAVAGLLALAVVFHEVDGTQASLYEGGFLVVALASAAVVAGLALPGARGPALWLLSRRVPVTIGRLSYGLYLWHWPVFLWLTPDRTGRTGLGLVLVRFAVAFALAAASYVAIEQPIRRHGLAGLCERAGGWGVPGLRPAQVAVACATAVAGVVIVAAPGPPESVVASPSVLQSAPPMSLPPPPSTTVVVPTGHPLPAVPAGEELRVMVGGDSVAWSLSFPLIRTPGSTPGVSLAEAAYLGCTVTPGKAIVEGVRIEAEACPDWTSAWERVAAASHPHVVVALWGAWEVYDHMDGDRLLRAGSHELGAAYRESLAAGIDRTIAVAPDTRFAFVTVPCMDDRNLWVGGADDRRNHPENLAWVNANTAAVAAAYGDRALMVDAGPLVCPGGRFAREVDGVTAREDGIHFTVEFAPVLWRYIEQRIRPWLARPGVTPDR
jgi:peptidoglycan/LPS O-acetylase OafA/YrhL